MGRLLKRIEQVSLLIALVSVAIIMVVVSLDAVLRYAFNSPLRWASELVRLYLMVIAIYFAVSATFTHGDHVSLTLFRRYFPPRLLIWLDIAWCLMGALVFAVIAYGTWGNVVHAWNTNEFTPGYVMWPSWLSHLPIPLGAALFVLRLLHHSLTLATRGNDPDVALEGDIVE